MDSLIIELLETRQREQLEEERKRQEEEKRKHELDIRAIEERRAEALTENIRNQKTVLE